jgi:integrase
MAINTAKIADKEVRTEWVKKWTAEFLKGLQELNTKESIESYCKEQKEAFEAEVKRLSAEKAKKDGKGAVETAWMNSAATHMSQIRNAIKEWQSNIILNELTSYPQQTKDGIVQQHFALLFMNYPRDFHEDRKEPTEIKKTQQRRNLTAINCLDKYLETVENLLASYDYRELAVGLTAATGRRISEILSTASFVQIGQFEADFEGQLKAKGDERKYSAFTLVESAKVIDGLLRLRRMPEIKEMRSWNLKEIDSGKNNTVNRFVKKAFSELIQPPHGESELSTKNLRAAYAAIAIYLFCPGNHSESLFIKERLGHTSDATASNYEDYQVTDINDEPLPRGRWMTRIGEPMTKPLQIETQRRLRMTTAAKQAIEDQEFLKYPDQVSRIEELVRLARLGKQYEDGQLVKEVVKVVEVVKEVEPAMEVSPVKEVEPVMEVSPVEPVKKSVTDRFQEMSSDELRGSHAPGSAIWKLRRSVEAIKAYNEQQAEKKHQWAINVSTLEELSGCHSKAVRDYLDSPEGRLNVADYNLEKGFGFQQNRGKGSIKEVLTW